METTKGWQLLHENLAARFEDADPPETALKADLNAETATALARLAGRGSQRRFKPDPVAPELLRLLSAVALSAPTKSDLQQRDIVLVTEPGLRTSLDALVDGQAWIAEAPALLVFCGNNRRQRQVHALRGRPFANDHLDAFFNAAVDAGIVLAAFVVAAEAVGLGCCPISALRNQAEEVSRLLGLPDLVFPVAGLAVGWPAAAPAITPRLPLAVTLHENSFDETGIDNAIAQYDRRRRYDSQRRVADYGEDPDYGWSEDKARQYAIPERADFGAFIRRKGFCLD